MFVGAPAAPPAAVRAQRLLGLEKVSASRSLRNLESVRGSSKKLGSDRVPPTGLSAYRTKHKPARSTVGTKAGRRGSLRK